MGKHGLSIEERLKADIVVNDAGCWIWQQSPQTMGYGRINIKGARGMLVHRLAYMEWVGSIPDGWDVGHKCHDDAARAGLCQPQNVRDCPHRQCINPAHLQAEPHGANLLASPLTLASINKAKTHCKRNHEFTSENTGLRKNKWRYCLACNRMTKEERAGVGCCQPVTR